MAHRESIKHSRKTTTYKQTTQKQTRSTRFYKPTCKMEKNEVLWDFLAEKLKQLSSSVVTGGSGEHVSTDTTHELYEASLKQFADERTSSTAR